MGKCQTAPKDRRAARGEGRTRGWRDALAGCPVAVHMLTEHKCRYACAARTLAGIAAQRLVAVPGSCAAIPMIDCASHQGEAMECERGARAQQKWPLISAGHPCAFHEFSIHIFCNKGIVQFPKRTRRRLSWDSACPNPQIFFFLFFPTRHPSSRRRGYGGFEFLSFLSFLRGFSLGVGFG